MPTATLTPPPASRLRALRSRRVVVVIATLLIGMALLIAVPLQAQLYSGAADVGLFVAKTSRLTIAASSGSGQTVTMVDGTVAQYALPVQFGVDWNFSPNTVNNVVVVGYFLDPANALVSGTDAIPASVIEGRVGTTAGWSPFNQTYTYAMSPATNANALHLWTSVPTRNADRRGNVTLDLYLRLNLSGRTVPVGTYAGTLVLQAFSQ